MPFHLPNILVLTFLLATLTAPAHAASWRLSTEGDAPVAISPISNMILKMRKPKEGIWGKLYINLNNEQVEALKEYRLDKYFAFISVGVEIDGYVRNTNAKVVEMKKFVRIDIDQRMWNDLKKGSRLIIYLPDGSTYKETLRGSSKALRALEKHVFSHY